MTRPEIRPATAEDAAELARLLDAFNREFDSPTLAVDVLERNLLHHLGGDQIAALIAGEPAVGMALLSFRPTVWGSGPVALIDELYVVPELRGQGIGRALMEATLARARAANAVWIEVTTGESDREARALYEGFGFTNLEASIGSPRMLYYELELNGDFIRPQA